MTTGYIFIALLFFGLGYVAALTQPMWLPKMKVLFTEAKDAVRRKLGRKS